MLKFGQREVTTKDFYGKRQITDIFTININNLVISDKVPCNNGKDCRYIVRYQADEVTLLLSIKTLKIYLVMVFHNTIKTLPIQFHLMPLRKKSGRLDIKRFGMRFSHSFWKNGDRTDKRRKQVRQWQVKNVERTYKDEFFMAKMFHMISLIKKNMKKSWWKIGWGNLSGRDFKYRDGWWHGDW